MIIRKPYAFLIKHFKKIHLILLVLSAFVYYKNLQLSSFVTEFMSLGTYDSYNEPITRFVTGFAIISMLLISVGSIMLILLLRHKKKPWKLYVLPALEYIFMMVVFFSAKNFFDSYNGIIDQAGIRAVRDLLFISSVLQYPAMLIFLIRAVGMDLKKFNFKMDEEYLALNSEDREELEISIDFDKDSLKRTIKKFIRNASYVYTEHKLIVNTIIIVLSVAILYTGYKFVFVTNKSYRQGDSLTANSYTITIHDSYYSDKDYAGRVISDKSAFVVVNLTIKNNYQQREVDLQKFHIMNGVNDYITTAKTYEEEFQDYGEAYESVELKKDESINMIMIFKVSKELSKKRFVLYYQEFNGDKPHLRKIKLKLNDVSEIKKHDTITLGKEMKFVLENEEETITLDDYELLDTTEYSYRICYSSECSTKTGKYTAEKGYKILKIPFSSNNFEGKDMIDFSSKYGTINYINNKNKRSVLKIKNPFNKTYYGKYLYIKIPTEVSNSSSIELEYTIRNNRYVYKLR